jgi:hypothetical protein
MSVDLDWRPLGLFQAERSSETAVSVGSSRRIRTVDVENAANGSPNGRPRTTNWPDWLRAVIGSSE